MQIKYCPHCKKPLAYHQGVNNVPGEGPKPNDIAVCDQCGELSIYDSNLELKKPTAQELEQTKQNDRESYRLALRYKDKLKGKKVDRIS